MIRDSESDWSSEWQLQDDDEDHEESDVWVDCCEEYRNTTKTDDWIPWLICKLWLHEDFTKFGDLCDVSGQK